MWLEEHDPEQQLGLLMGKGGSDTRIAQKQANTFSARDGRKYIQNVQRIPAKKIKLGQMKNKIRSTFLQEIGLLASELQKLTQETKFDAES